MISIRREMSIAAAAALLLAMLFWRPEPVTIGHALLASAATCVLMLGVAWYWRNRDYLGSPIFPLSLAFYFMSFIVPLYFLEFVWGVQTHIGVANRHVLPVGETVLLGLRIDNIAYLGTKSALWIVVAGVSTYVAAFVILRPALDRALPHLKLPEPVKPNRPALLLWALAAVALAIDLLPAFSSIPSLGQLFKPIGYVVFGGFLLLWYAKRIPGWHALLGIVTIMTAFASSLLSHWGLTPIMYLGVLYILIHLRSRKKVPIIPVVLLALVFGVFYSGIQYYRHIITDEKLVQQLEEPTFVGHLTNLGRIIGHQWIGSRKHLSETAGLRIKSEGLASLRPSLRRVALLPLLSHVAAQSPSTVPYWEGHSYRNLGANFIPRILWPGKPEERFGNSFGHRYDLINPKDDVTAVNIPWLVELFANFGVSGVMIGMAFFGALMAILDRVLNAVRMAPLESAIGLAVFLPLFFQESNFTVVAGHTGPLIVLFYLFFRFGLVAQFSPQSDAAMDLGAATASVPGSARGSARGSGADEGGPRSVAMLLPGDNLERRRSLIWIAVLTIAAAASAAILRPAYMSVTQAEAVVVFITVLGATAAWYRSCKGCFGLPLFPVSLIFYVLTFIAPFYLLPFLWPSTGEPVILLGFVAPDRYYLGTTAALLMVLIGVVGYVLGFMPARTLVFDRMPRMKLPEVYSDRRLILLLWGLLGGHLIYVFVSFVAYIPSVGQFLQPAGYVAFGMFFLLWVRGRLSPMQAALVFLVALPAVLVDSFLDWLITPIMLMGIFFVLVYYHNFQRAPLMVMLVAVAFLFATYTGIQFYRVIEKNENWVQQQGQLGTGTRIANFGKLLVHIWFEPGGEDWRMFDEFKIKVKGLEATRPIAKRMSLLPLLSHVTNQTPENVPYWSGDTYRNLFVSIIPRVLWPGKPQERLGNEFGHRYSLIADDDTSTSVNIPWLVEFYANFGSVGVFWGMFLVGIFMAAIDRFFNAPGMRGLEVIVGLAVIFPLVYQESNFTVMTGSLLPLALSFWLYFRIGLTVGERSGVVATANA